MVIPKGNGTVEYRLVSKFTSVKQMMRRYELFYELMDTAVNYPRRQHRIFYAKIRPILMMMYNDNEAKVNDILAKAESFDKFINKGIIDVNTQSVLDADGYHTGRWDEGVQIAQEYLYEQRQNGRSYGWKKENWK